MILTINIENEAMGHAMAQWFKADAIFSFNESPAFYKAMDQGAIPIEDPGCVIEKVEGGYNITVLQNE